MSVKLGANKDVTKYTKKDAIEVEKLGANKRRNIRCKKLGAKMDVKKDEKKYAIDGVL